MTSTLSTDSLDRLRQELSTLLGTEHVLSSQADRRFYSQDISGAGELVACVVRPGDTDELARAVALATGNGCAVVARGGGASYTGGYLADRPEAVVVDMSRFQRVTAIDVDDMYVTVEGGCTWRGLYDALRPFGMRTPFWGPLSGGIATVGGSLSQHSILWGSARYGVSADSVLGLQVVLADGTVVTTGSGAVRTARPFFRHYGPDLTGLFLGDSGALGIKTTATLRLIRAPAVVQTASFGFDTHEDMAVAMAGIAREGLVTECFGMDPALQRQRMKRAGLAKDVKALRGVVTSAPGLAQGVKEAAKVALAGRRFLDDVSYSLHLGTEGRHDAEVTAAMQEVRRIVAAHGGREVENTIPKVLRGDPYVPMTSAIGPEGERWLPVHAVVRLSDAVETWTAVTQLFEQYREPFERHAVQVGVLTAIIGANAFVLEPVFYWQAPRTPYYERVLDASTLAKFTEFPPNPEGEALVFEVRARLTELFLARGATHLQIGRAYRYREGLKPETWRVLEAIKAALDPKGLMNPGSLGLVSRAPASQP